jgi:hypothetical protein
MSYQQDLTNASYHAANNANRINQAIDHLLHQLHTLDGYPTQTVGADNPAPRGQRCITVPLETAGHPHLTPDGKPAIDRVPVTAVEDVALKRQAIGDQLADIVAHTRGILTMHLELSTMLTAAIATRATADIKPCDATGREGWKLLRESGGWADPDCTNIPARGPLCIPCYHRERRWRIEHGLPTRDTEAA